MAVRKLHDLEDQDYDICIIGTGPAGLTLCNELAKSDIRICVLESGSFAPNAQTEDLKEVTSTGEVAIKPQSRERAWGGTSHTWSGLSAPLDKTDFDRWPISYEVLLPYYKKLDEYGFAPFGRFITKTNDEIRTLGNVVPRWTYVEEKLFVAKDPPINFGKYLQHLLLDTKIDLCLDATVTALGSPVNEKIPFVIVADSANATFRVRAKVFVLCTGGIESVRLLLLPTSTSPKGTGNEHDQVGRFIMNHPKNYHGVLKLKTPVESAPYFFGYLNRGFSGYAGLRITEKLQRESRLLNSYIRLEPIFPWTDSRGVFALITLVKRARSFLQWWKKRRTGLIELKDWNETGDDDTASAPQTINTFEYMLMILWDIRRVISYVRHRLQPQKVFPITNLRIRNFMEMEPRPDNRLTLGTKRDRFGNPLPVVDVHMSDLDKTSLVHLHELFAKEVAELGLGTLESDLGTTHPWPITLDASHHLGGAVMGTSPQTSVVDINLKIHSLNNLYVCSGSVFPTSGCANPTYTICALALRLSEHLKQKVL